MTKLDLSDFSSDKAKIKYFCANQAVVLSQSCPEDLYPDFNFFTKLLESDNNILKWTAIKVIGNLSKVDNKKKAEKILPSLITLLFGKSMITAANTIGALTYTIKLMAVLQNAGKSSGTLEVIRFPSTTTSWSR